ncbi:hypothetical protein JW935_08640 [candidate division KSB1 bacterium]|nr:hypothetical protein [candidate division KSB1 bacterium]
MIIQENELGFCALDGYIDSNVGGYTGDGYANTDSGVGVSISWSIQVANTGQYSIK